MRGFFWFGTVLLFGPLGCQGGPPDPFGEPLRVQTGEIQILAEAQFTSVRDMSLVGDDLWVLDGFAPFVTRVPLGAEPVLRIGPEGQGPGEFKDPWALQLGDRDGRIGVQIWDRGTLRVSFLDRDGEVMGMERLSERGVISARTDIREVSYIDPFRIRNVGSQVAVGRFPRRIDRTADFISGALWKADGHLEPEVELVRFSEHVGRGSDGLREWAPVPVWDACDGVIALWSPESSKVHWFDSSGEFLYADSVEVTRVPVSAGDIERYLQWMGRLELGPDYLAAGISFSGMAREHRHRFAQNQPFATDLQCETRGTAWLRRFDTRNDPLGRGPVWLKVSEGEPPQAVMFPAEFTPFLFTSQGTFGLFETSDGSQQPACWSDHS